ncbi:SpoIIE family protein phosphatase [Streptomyces radicis]|uniref:GAF domain-containing protein n=1 Tax=Streptomyces radicis TaxID=1750517 RepID=A0A3A9WHS4_9ACTN|nr:SpoIIE family protein phosphatase [Streptomyces radicis]RKN12568.1 GAF domain-containing protein [Streptomyces radicis]RKN27666.1 GAF domain-containing protein [Streptomyces radicis]
MNAIPHPGRLNRPLGGAAALLLLDRDGRILTGTASTERLIGRRPGELRGMRFSDLVGEPEVWADLEELTDVHEVGHGFATLRRPDGRSADVRIDVFPLLPDRAPRQLVALTAGDAARRQEENRALMRALFSQSRVGLAIHDADLRITRMNGDPAGVARPTDAPRGFTLPAALDDILVAEDARATLDRFRHVTAVGEPLIQWEHSGRLKAAPQRERLLARSALRLQDTRGRPLGVLSIFSDITEQRFADRRMDLLHDAAQRIGPSLDVTRNAEELARVLVPRFADLAAVDLSEALLTGDEPGAVHHGAPVRRVAAEAADGAWPPGAHACGATFRIHHPPDHSTPEVRTLREEEVTELRTGSVEDAPDARPDADDGGLLPDEHGSRMAIPLRARGQVLGSLAVWRSPERPAFGDWDAELAEEIGSRAALSVDNARRYTREHRTLESLQRSLLPQPDFAFSAARAAGGYVPAATAAGIGGSWYDVIPLSSARVAFVIGDVAGHGLSATATMGRLRTAVQTLADLDLAPDELLNRLDDLAIRLADVEPHPDGTRGGAIGATCLYCVYDPVTGHCAMAAAGRVPPVVAEPGGPARDVTLEPGPSLGTGGPPFETARLRLEPGSMLLFFSEQLVARSGEGRAGGAHGRARRLALLRDRVTASAAAGDAPATVGRAVLDALLPDRSPANDVALLAATVHALPDDATADWEFPADPAAVGRARDAVITRLKDWDLAEHAFASELIVSELVTNAIRYAGGPVGLRLIRDKTLICEVSDPSETQPHLRRARPTDEGGRGLFLVAQVAHRWGSRYTVSGKTIWTEQLMEQADR